MPEYDALRIRLERISDSDVYRVHAATTTGEATGSFTVPVWPLRKRAASAAAPGEPRASAST